MAIAVESTKKPRPSLAKAMRGPNGKHAPPPEFVGLLDPPAPTSNGTNGTHAPPAMPDEILTIPLKSIAPSPSNPRKKFDEASLAELAASIRSVGVLEPIIVRPHPRQGGGPLRYELVAGERRVRASGLAGAIGVPAIVRTLTDTQVREIQVVENEQREDTSALEKADGYQALIDNDGYTVERIAEKVGKSVSTIRNILKLRQLPKAAADALEAGRISPSVAMLIARVPTPLHRDRAAECVLKGVRVEDPAAFADPAEMKIERPRWDRDNTDPLTFRETKELIETNCTVELKRAPFSRKALDLVPAAGSCEDCPKRVGNLAKSEPDEYKGARADVCTDPGCFREKVKAWQAGQEAAAKEKGQKVLSDKEAAKLFPYGGRLKYDCVYLDLAAECDEDHGRKTCRSWKQLLDGHIEEKEIVLARDPKGQLHMLVDKDRAIGIAKKEHGLFKSSGWRSASTSSRTDDAAEKARRAKQIFDNKVDRETKYTLLGKAAAAGEAIFRSQTQGLPVLRAIAHLLADSMWGSVREDVCGRRKVAGGTQTGKLKALGAWIDGATGPEVMGLLAELTAGKLAAQYGGPTKATKELAGALGLPKKADVEKEVRARLTAEKKAKKAGGKKGGSSPLLADLVGADRCEITVGDDPACLDCEQVADSYDDAGRCPECASDNAKGLGKDNDETED